VIFSLFTPTGHHLTCETLLDQIPRQPFNTYSNFGYFLCAIVLLRLSKADKSRNHFRFGVLAAWIGCASVLAHSLFVPFFNMIDYASIFFFVLTIAGKNPALVKRVPVIRSFIGKLLLVFIYFGMQFFHHWVAPGIFLVSVATFIFAEWFTTQNLPAEIRKKFLTAVIVFGLGFACLAVDVISVFCDPDVHTFQWHGLWHLGSAAAIYFISQYYISLALQRRLPN